MIYLFWISFALIAYTYFGYPLLLLSLKLARSHRDTFLTNADYQPFVSLIIPVYNEERIIEAKIENTISLNYPKDKLEILIVSDGSKDHTEDIVKKYANHQVRLLSLPMRRGKSAALNAGLNATDSEIIIFSDASIMLDMDAIRNIVSPFVFSEIGCVSGEDHISEGSGEGLYGKYELFLRNLESRVNSIVGASGCFYAQRSSLCQPFIEGMAPDFLSVLATVEKKFRAVTQPSAVGIMKSVSKSSEEYNRKVRTFIRGITTLMHFKRLLNPFKLGFFSIELISHKLMRWFSGIFFITLAVSNIFLVSSFPYAIFLVLQSLFYCMAIIGWINHNKIIQNRIFRIPFYFCMVNISALTAWIKYLGGIRQEIWEPSKR